MKSYLVEYLSNKFCPYVIVAFLVFYKIGFNSWEPYAIMGLIYFIDRFSFKTGHAVATCTERGIDIDS